MTGVRHPLIHWKECLFAFFVAICLTLTAGPAKANIVTWTLQNVIFDDGGTATGTYDYDATTDTLSNINITTTAGSAFGGTSYTYDGSPFSDSMHVDVYHQPYVSGSMTGLYNLYIQLTAAMTDAGGSIPLLVATEATCDNSDCSSTLLGELRSTVSGSVVSTVSTVPLPGALPLFATGLGGLGLLAWRRKKKAAALAA